MKINELLKLTNKEFAAQIKTFSLCCAKAGIKPTKRQAAKWRNRAGIAFSCK
jgi:predicted HicB family RNase H-like nuclease